MPGHEAFYSLRAGNHSGQIVGIIPARESSEEVSGSFFIVSPSSVARR
jgi:hypothetical protein